MSNTAPNNPGCSTSASTENSLPTNNKKEDSATLNTTGNTGKEKSQDRLSAVFRVKIIGDQGTIKIRIRKGKLSPNQVKLQEDDNRTKKRLVQNSDIGSDISKKRNKVEAVAAARADEVKKEKSGE